MIDINNIPKYVKHRHGWIAEHIGINIAGDCLVFIGRNDTIEWPIKYFEPSNEDEFIAYSKKLDEC